MARAQTIQIYLPSGNPAGIRVASITTRTVRVLEVPRSLLSEFLKRPESGQVGVYFLFGSDGDETTQAYIGQTGNVGGRLQQHAKSKDFWTRAMVAVSLTNEWTSTHVSYLECVSISRATTAGRYPLLNGNQASNPHTPEPLEADCLEFLDTIASLLATLGSPILEPVKAAPTVVSMGIGGTEDDGRLFLQNAGCEGRGYLTSEGLLVLAGSRGRAKVSANATEALRRRREILKSEGVIAVDGGGLVFLKDYLFSSPSAAGNVLVGRNTNGRTNWKNGVGQSLSDLEELEIASAVDSPGPANTLELVEES
ncbi:GIY-YIG nuclease family protein [Rhodococcus erythropolis]|uniref:GIY-YIG nuclease family protein n=1 Tax=Rhodococcus erythropolis TaxID=1833 RepID=UPI001BECAFB7|nr:GIY-YIG nuclease family protein [Rhodococcus erythropolis]MBT2269796.1 GIY-YIG nuclease family protein [Rhodococcus erythropolis]